MKALLDVNILLDVVLNRQPWVQHALAISSACADRRMTGYVAAFTVPTLYYIVRRSADKTRAAAAVDLCLQSFEVCTVDRAVLELAQSLDGSDIEDRVQIACAVLTGLDAVITRDPTGFENSVIRVLSPEEAIAALK